MEDKEQTPPVQVPTEANNYKHIDTPEGEETDKGTNDNEDKSEEDPRLKHDADSGNEGSSDDVLQKEKIIDPGNEHHHQSEEDTEKPGRNNDGVNDTGTTGPAPGEGKNDEPDTSGEAG